MKTHAMDVTGGSGPSEPVTYCGRRGADVLLAVRPELATCTPCSRAVLRSGDLVRRARRAWVQQQRDGMTVSEALEWLDDAGSADDPVRCNGHWTTPSRIEPDLGKLASRTSVAYYAEGGSLVSGTLLGMVIDRLCFLQTLEEYERHHGPWRLLQTRPHLRPDWSAGR